MATLELPNILENPVSWGPPPGSSAAISAILTSSSGPRLDKMPKAADWIGVTASGTHSVKELVELDDYEIAGANKQKKATGPTWSKFGAWQQRGRGAGYSTLGSRGGAAASRARGGAGRGGNANRGRGRMTSQTVGHASTLNVQDAWVVKHHLTLTSLSKINEVDPPVEADLVFHGMCHYYDTNMDSIESFNAVPLKKCQKTFYRVTTMEDEIIREMALELVEQNKRVVITNDNILSTLMTAPRSIFSWEVRATKAGEVIFLDWNIDNPLCNCYTVNETSPQPPYDCETPKDPIMTATALSQEATSLTKNLTQVVLTPSVARVRLGENVQKKANPFVEDGDDPCSTLYRYRSFTLNQGKSDEIVFIVRTEIDGATKGKDSQVEFVRTFAVNEVDDKAIAQWRAQLNSSRGMILGNFIKTNACKVCRWACMSVLSGASKVKLGYVVRKDPFNNANHQILGVETRATAEFAAQVGFSTRNAWSIVYRFAMDLLGMDDGEYMMVKDAGKATMTWYYIPEEEEEEEEENDVEPIEQL